MVIIYTIYFHQRGVEKFTFNVQGGGWLEMFSISIFRHPCTSPPSSPPPINNDHYLNKMDVSHIAPNFLSCKQIRGRTIAEYIGCSRHVAIWGRTVHTFGKVTNPLSWRTFRNVSDEFNSWSSSFSLADINYNIYNKLYNNY